MAFTETPPPSLETLQATDDRRKRQRWILAFALGAALLVAIAALTATGGTGSTDEAVNAANDREAAPDIEFELIGSGDTTSLAAFEGTPLVLNFYASWCAPCVAELPEFERVSQDLAGDVTFLGLNVSDRPEDAARVTSDAGVTFTLGLDPTGEIVSTFNSLGTMPTTVLIDAEGNIVHVTPSRILEEDLRELITDLFGVEA